MARKLVLILVLVLLLLWGGYWYVRHRMDVELAAQWLARDCTVTDQVLFEKSIRDRGEALEPVFIDAFTNGPPQTEVDQLLSGIDAVYKRRQERISGGDQQYRALTGDLLSLADEKQQAKDNYDHGYRAAALNGLRITGRPAGRQLLLRLSAQEQASPYQYLAKLFLQR